MPWLGRGDRRDSTPSEYLSPYREMVTRVGAASFESLLWSSRQTQQARFEAISQMIDLGGKRILDAGCGHADLALFLESSGIAYASYVGVEALPAMLDQAKRRSPPRAELIEGDFVADAGLLGRVRPQADVIIFSGSLNTLAQPEAVSVLDRAWQACGEALAFNFLCAPRHGQACEWGDSPVRKFDAAAMLAWAVDRTPLVSFRQDYLAGTDGTIVMRVG